MPNEQPGQITARALASDLIVAIFWPVAIVSLINFHHIANMVLPSGWFVTAGVVAACMAMIALAPVRIGPVLGRHGWLMIAAIAGHGAIGTAVAVVAGVDWHSRDPYLVLRPWFSIAVTVGSALGGSVVLSRFGVERVLIGVLLLMGIAAALIFASPWLIEHVYVQLSESERSFFTNRRSRHSGTFVNPIPAGMAACSAAAVGLALLGLTRRFWIRLLGLGVVVVASFAVLLTLSRTAAVALCLVVAIFLFSPAWRLQRRLPLRGKVLVATFIGAVALVVIYRETFDLSFHIVDRFFGIVAGERRAGISERLALLAYGFRFVAESPLIGNGLSALGWMKGAVLCQTHTTACGVHNSFLQYWGEAGIVPAILLALAVVTFLRQARRLPRSLATDTAFGWTLVFALACLVTDGVPYFLWHSFLFGLSCALLSHAARAAPATSVGTSSRDGLLERKP